MSGDKSGDASADVSGDGRWLTYEELAQIRGSAGPARNAWSFATGGGGNATTSVSSAF
jgi:hypothetical protein